MHVRYRSDYANQVHQLLVSVSRHLYVAADGRVLYQKKAFEVTIENLRRSPKEHLIHYLIRDQFSGHCYAEVARSKDLVDPKLFLMRAWTPKPEHSFCGAPDILTLPATVARVFPDLASFIASWGIRVIEPASGFQAGVRDLQTWEQNVRFDFHSCTFDDAREMALVRSFLLSTNTVNGESKLSRWRAGLVGPLRIPTPLEEEVPAES